MHGIGGNRTNWSAQLPLFAKHFSCVAWDARGYGASDDYDGELAFDDFVADVLGVLDHFGAARAHLLGLSMGGRIAMRTALLHPEKVATLTLLDTHEGFEAFTPEQRHAFVNSRREPLLAGKEPRDIADAVARSLVGPKARPEPAHFIVGADRLTPVAMHHEMAAKLHGALVSVVPDAGHLSNIENSDAFNAAALQWLVPRAAVGEVPVRWPATIRTQ